MRAATTCHACRHLLARHASTGNIPLRTLATSSRRSSRQWHPPRPFLRPYDRRTFFNFFQKPPREVRVPEFEPGMEDLFYFSQQIALGLRPPPRVELIKAWRALFQYKFRHQRVANALNAAKALELFDYLIQTKEDGEDLTELLGLRDAVQVLLWQPGGSTRAHLRLSRDMYRYLKEQQREGAAAAKTEQEWDDFRHFIRACAQYGDASRVGAKIKTFLGVQLNDETLLPEKNERKTHQLWMIALRGLAKEGDETGLKLLLANLREAGLPYNAAVQEMMVMFYAKQDESKSDGLLRRWFERKAEDGAWPSAGTYRVILQRYAGKAEYPAWVTQAMQELCNANPPKELWDVILQWAVYQRKSMDEITRIMQAMVDLNAQDEQIRPDIITVNTLMRTAIELGDNFQAERLFAVAAERGLQPNASTFALQLECRLSAGDTSGALETFEKLMYGEALGASNHLVVNRYIKRLCTDPKQASTHLTKVLSMAENQNVVLTADTLAALCICFLKNDQNIDVLDTLSVYIWHMDFTERDLVLQSLISYCIDRTNTSTARAWDTYSLIQQYFLEATQADRVRMMDAFFLRRRSDMAALIFGHMRAHDDPGIRPNVDTYVRCLEGIGYCPADIKSLQMIHNMFKMDAMIQPTTKLYNAFIIAYTTCEDYNQAMRFWQEITRSKEGPNHKSLVAIFRALQVKPYGFEAAAKIWNKLQQMNVDVPASVYWAYVTCQAGQVGIGGDMDLVKELIQGMRAATSVEPGALTFGETFNALVTLEAQKDFEAWASEAYPDKWANLVQKGFRKTHWGGKKFKIKPTRQTA